MLAIVRHFGIPQKLAVDPAERDQVSVIGHHEDLLAQQSYSAIDRRSSIPDHSFRERARVVPDLPPIAGVESPRLVRSRDVHHSVRDHGCHFEVSGSRDREHPFRGQASYVTGVDLLQRTVAVPALARVITPPSAAYWRGEIIKRQTPTRGSRR